MTSKPGTLISTEYLAARLNQPGIRVLDASWYMEGNPRDADEEFAAGHIPGARRFNLALAAAPRAPLLHTLPTAEQFAAFAGSCGVSAEDEVIIYDAAGMSPSARAWWMFKVHGHQNVSVLDGGLDKWKKEGRPLATGANAGASAEYAVRRVPGRLADMSAVEAAIRSGKPVVDARPAARFAGKSPEPRAGLRSGNIPGSVNLPWTTLVNPEMGTFRNDSEIDALFRQAGVDPARSVICTCGSAVTACALALCLEHLGNREVAVYNGSWTEWATLHPAQTPAIHLT